jgi:hypothetical protein
MRDIPMGRYQSQGRPGTPSPTPRVPMRWLLSVGMYGASLVIQHPSTPQTAEESQERNSRAWSKRSVTHIEMSKVELSVRRKRV